MKKIIYIILFALLVSLTGCTDETKVTGVTLNPSELTMNVGETRQIELLIEPLSSVIYNAKYWSSSDQKVATVDEKGNITAVYAGTCTITASVDGKKATCKVTVISPEYDLQMKNAALYMTGVDAERGVMTQVLRLYDDGLTMDSTGTVTGNGLMLSLALCAPATTVTLTEGRYAVSGTGQEFTIKPGEMREEGGKYYITGSFLGQYSDYGLSVLALTDGEIMITTEGGEYRVETTLSGELGEQVRASWSGNPTKYRSDTTIMPEPFSYSTVVINDTIIDGETTTKHTVVRLKDGEKTLQLLFRVPLTATSTLLTGHYLLSENEQPYTISNAGSRIIERSKTSDIQSASITISYHEGEWVFKGSIETKGGSSYAIEPAEKNRNNLTSGRRYIEKILVSLQPP